MLIFPLVSVSLLTTAGVEPMAMKSAHSTVAFDLSQLPADTFAKLDGVTLERAVLVRMMQDGFAIVQSTQSPVVIVRLAQQGQTLILRATGPWGSADTELQWRGEALDEVYLALAQKAVGLARALITPPQNEDTPTRAVAETTPFPPAAPSVFTEPHSELEASLHADALWRAGAVDPEVRVGLRWRIMEHWAIACAVAGAWSHGAGIGVGEAFVGCGPGIRVNLAARLTLGVAVLLGAYVQRFSLADKTLSGADGARMDFMAGLPLEAVYWLWSHLGVGIVLVPGFTAHGYEHLEVGHLLWRRGAWGLEAGAGMTASW